MPQNEHIELAQKRYGRRLDHEEKKRKKEARSVKKVAKQARSVRRRGDTRGAARVGPRPRPRPDGPSAPRARRPAFPQPAVR